MIPTRIRDRRLKARLEEQSLSLLETQIWLRDLIQSGRDGAVARPGGIESEVLDFFLRRRFSSSSRRRPSYPRGMARRSAFNAGISNNSPLDLDSFSETYLRAILEADLVGYGMFARPGLAWAGSAIALGRQACEFQSLSPFEAIKKGAPPWTQALAGKKVLVVHPFEKSIQSQYELRSEVSGCSEILPNFDLITLKPPMSFAGLESGESWVDNLARAKKDLESHSFDVALVGAGSYGLPLAVHAKRIGRVGIHLGGILQTLFGIRGKRFEEEGSLDLWVDETWVRPSLDETPAGASKIEGGAYW